jgi:ABC-type methionine transport system permease subunit
MPRGSHRGSITDVVRQRRLRIVLALLLVALMPFALKQYVVQEYLVALIAIILVSVPVLLVLVAFVLLQDGLRRAQLGLKATVVHLAVWSHLHLRAGRLRGRP